MKYKTYECRGYWLDKKVITNVLISTDEWDGVPDAEDERIFFYTDGEPLEVGMVVSDGFVICGIQENAHETNDVQ